MRLAGTSTNDASPGLDSSPQLTRERFPFRMSPEPHPAMLTVIFASFRDPNNLLLFACFDSRACFCMSMTEREGAGTSRWQIKKDRRSGFTECHDHHRREATSASAAEVRWCDQGKRQGFHSLVGPAGRAAQRCAERSAHHDRRPGLRCFDAFQVHWHDRQANLQTRSFAVVRS